MTALSLRAQIVPWLLAVAWLLSGTGATFAQFAYRSIEDFVATKDKWESMLDTPQRLEGRYSILGNRDLRFFKCDLDFRLPAGFVKGAWDTDVLLVDGKLVKENGKLVFLVTAISPGQDDLEQLSRRSSQNSNDPGRQYDAAAWARGRAAFYGDQKLLEAAQRVDENGLRVEFGRSDPGDEKTLAALIEKGRQKQVSEDLVREIVHDSIWAGLKHARAQPFQEDLYHNLRLRTERELPGANEVIPNFSQEVRAAYLRDPRSAFQQADAARRQVLARMLMIEILSSRIMAALRSDGANGFEIAQQLTLEAPERIDLIKQANELAIANHRSKAAVMTRSALLEFTDRLVQLGDAPQAEAVKREWLTTQESRLDSADAAGRSNLAEQWLVLVGDEAAAARLHMGAAKIKPDHQPSVEWLTAHNYTRLGTGWSRSSAAPPVIRTEMDQAIELGQVLPGMTAAQVRLALGTLPNSVVRMASARRIVELWIYDGGYVVHFERDFHQKESRVVRLESTTGTRGE